MFAAKFHLGTAAITNTVLRIKDPLPDRKDQKPDPLQESLSDATMYLEPASL